MGKLKLNTKLKDEKGNELGTKIQCLVVNANNTFETDKTGNLIVAEREDNSIKQTLKDVICTSLLHDSPSKPLSGVEKSKRYKLWLLITNSGETVDLKPDEIVIIRDCILEVQPILIGGQCEVLLEE